MVMRYHWGLAIGHLYTHGGHRHTTTNSNLPTVTADLDAGDTAPRLRPDTDMIDSDAVAERHADGYSGMTLTLMLLTGSFSWAIVTMMAGKM
jgi:hypothetical protein